MSFIKYVLIFLLDFFDKIFVFLFIKVCLNLK